MYYLARYYQPEVGRFTSSDPRRAEAADPATTNLFSYVHDNPVGHVDPLGQAALSVLSLKHLLYFGLGLVAGFGAAVGAVKGGLDQNVRDHVVGWAALGMLLEILLFIIVIVQGILLATAIAIATAAGFALCAGVGVLFEFVEVGWNAESPLDVLRDVVGRLIATAIGLALFPFHMYSSIGSVLAFFLGAAAGYGIGILWNRNNPF